MIDDSGMRREGPRSTPPAGEARRRRGAPLPPARADPATAGRAPSPDPRTPPPNGRPGRALLFGAVSALLVALVIEWLGWRIVWRVTVTRELDASWWFEFARGAIRNAASAALVSAVGVAVIGIVPAGRRWLRSRLIPVFMGGVGIFLLLLLLVTVWGSVRA